MFVRLHIEVPDRKLIVHTISFREVEITKRSLEFAALRQGDR